MIKPNQIDRRRILSVYSGRPGCMCGCRGKYFYSKATREKASEAQGYDVKDKEINQAQITRVMNLLIKENVQFEHHDDPNFCYVQVSPQRCYCVYLTD